MSEYILLLWQVTFDSKFWSQIMNDILPWYGKGFWNWIISFELRHPRCVSNKSKCNVYTLRRQTQLSTRLYANLLNVNLN